MSSSQTPAADSFQANAQNENLKDQETFHLTS